MSDVLFVKVSLFMTLIQILPAQAENPRRSSRDVRRENRNIHPLPRVPRNRSGDSLARLGPSARDNRLASGCRRRRDLLGGGCRLPA